MTDNPSQQPSRPPMAFVLLERPVEPHLPAVVDALQARHPNLPVRIPRAPGQPNSTLLECDGELIAVMSIPAAMPYDEAAVVRAESIWPKAAATIGAHRGHLIVSALGQDLDRLPAARIVTAVVGAMIAAVPGSVAVVWDGSVAHPAARWLDMSRAAFAPYPDFPFMLWLSIQPFRDGSNIVAVTFGLSAFVGREIEFEGKGLDLPSVINKVAGLAVYQIERGRLIPDGDSFGSDEQERLGIHHAISRRFRGLPVLLASAVVGERSGSSERGGQ